MQPEKQEYPIHLSTYNPEKFWAFHKPCEALAKSMLSWETQPGAFGGAGAADLFTSPQMTGVGLSVAVPEVEKIVNVFVMQSVSCNPKYRSQQVALIHHTERNRLSLRSKKLSFLQSTIKCFRIHETFVDIQTYCYPKRVRRTNEVITSVSV